MRLSASWSDAIVPEGGKAAKGRVRQTPSGSASASRPDTKTIVCVGICVSLSVCVSSSSSASMSASVFLSVSLSVLESLSVSVCLFVPVLVTVSHQLSVSRRYVLMLAGGNTSDIDSIFDIIACASRVLSASDEPMATNMAFVLYAADVHVLASVICPRSARARGVRRQGLRACDLHAHPAGVAAQRGPPPSKKLQGRSSLLVGNFAAACLPEGANLARITLCPLVYEGWS